VNEVFCSHILRHVNADDTVWIHDYHFFLLPQLLRAKLPSLTIGFFLHIPFPSSEIFRILPWKSEILRGMAGADLIGFHTYDYVLHFLQSMQKVLGIEHEFGQMMIERRTVRADAFPLGIDFEKFQSAVAERGIQSASKRLREKIGKRKVILSIDRLDYTKGISERLTAFRELLHRHPELRGQMTLIMVVALSRTKVKQYRSMRKQIDELVGNINGSVGTLEWTPIWYLTRTLGFRHLLALYSLADIALITPLRDGMNLISKEFLACKTNNKGVLILSEMAGAASELSEAVLVNPIFLESMVQGLLRALRMPEAEQVRRNKLMRESLKRRHARFWAENFLARLEEVKSAQKRIIDLTVNASIRTKLVKDFQQAKKPLLFLDYDGTLTAFKATPEKARPSARLLSLIRRIAQRSTFVVTSGRPRRDLERWFKDIPLNIVAEHGVWIRKGEQPWQQLEQIDHSWKANIREILERYVDSTPGSFIEEKEFSLAWHSRLVDPELRQVRTRDLMSILPDLIRNYGLDVREGNRVIEVKSAGVDKGKAALQWIDSGRWDFIFAAGDEWTDEDMFRVLPPDAFSIKVGYAPSHAKWHVPSHTDILTLLREFVREEQ
jgi:trehalose 6-phosphate synthase/phosphatase